MKTPDFGRTFARLPARLAAAFIVGIAGLAGTAARARR